MAKKDASRPGEKTVATNRRAHRDFEILDTLEAGLVLKGSEVKSLRDAKVSLTDTYATIDRGEAWLVGLHINPYRMAAGFAGHDPDRNRKMLLHRHQLDQWAARLNQEHLTIVPLRLYFKDGRAKMEVGLAKGRKNYDKRQVIARRDAERDAAREMARARRR